MLEHRSQIHKTFNKLRKASNPLYSSMQRQFTNMKDLHRDKALLNVQKIGRDPTNSLPRRYAAKLASPQILKPSDPHSQSLPREYQNELDSVYQKALGAAIEKSAIFGRRGSDDPHQRSKSNLTNAEHYAMTKNHMLLVSKVAEAPHHFFQVEHAPIPKPVDRHDCTRVIEPGMARLDQTSTHHSRTRFRGLAQDKGRV